MHSPLTLEDGARIAVVGGGPTGTFFSIFALKMARMMGKEITVTIFEPKDFTREGPAGCNRCGGLISEILIQTLALEGIVLPGSVVQKGIDSFMLHTDHGSTLIQTPSHERTIATVYRGGGPRGKTGEEKESFDQYLLDRAIHEGALHEPVKIDRIQYANKQPVLFSRNTEIMHADLVVGAFGLNSTTAEVFEDMEFGYTRPKTTTGAVAEFFFDHETIATHFGHSIHSFLLPYKNIRLGAIIPKGNYVTACILGTDIRKKTVDDFFSLPTVRNIMPDRGIYDPGCFCLPKLNVAAPRTAFDDRVVVCGDAGSTRLYKDGLGAAYYMGKAAANTAILHGVHRQAFRDNFYTTYRNTVVDNFFGKYLFLVTDIYRRNKVLLKGMLSVIQNEQGRAGGKKLMSSMIWDMFTGNKKFKEVVLSAFDCRLLLGLCKHCITNMTCGGNGEKR